LLFKHVWAELTLVQMGVDDVGLFDAHIEVYTGDKRIKIAYDRYVTATVIG
jgi:hypothetical protein